MSDEGGIAPQWVTLPRRYKIKDKQVPRPLLRKRQRKHEQQMMRSKEILLLFAEATTTTPTHG